MQCLTQQRLCSKTKRPFGLMPMALVLRGLVLTILLTPTITLAKIYKTVDEDGNVSYSDVAPANGEQRTESTIELEINNTYNAEQSGPAPSTNPRGANDAMNPGDIVNADGSVGPQAPTSAYQSVSISAPAANSELRSNNGDITLSINLQPSLRAGDQVRFFMDGKPVGTVSGTSLSLTNIDRGTHTLAAVVLDGAGGSRISSSTTSFTIHRFAPRLAPKK